VGIGRTRGVCVVNPGGDLAKSEATLTPLLEANHWRAVRGPAGHRSVQPATWPSALLHPSLDVYLYVGHGDSLCHFPLAPLAALTEPERSHWTWRPAALLMGCASACPESVEAGLNDPLGTVTRFLMAGCSMAAGCLWAVTDGDLDRLTAKALNNFYDDRLASVAGGAATATEQTRPRDSTRHDDDAVVARLSHRMSARLSVSRPECRNQDDTTPAVINGPPRGVSLFDAFIDARSACKLRTLTGAALVLFGVPLECHGRSWSEAAYDLTTH
jgi:hypothetical protein